MHLLRNDRCGILQRLNPGEFRSAGRVWQFPVLEWEPWEQRSLSSAVPCLETEQVDTSLSWEMQSGRMGLSLTFHNSPDVLERTARCDRTCFIRTVILVGFSDAQVELSLQTSDAGFVGMLKHTETTHQCYLSRCCYLQPQPLKGTQSPFQPARETQTGVIF